jgi:hypothetical protein
MYRINRIDLMTSKQDYQDEAERLARLPPAEQAAVIGLYRHLADSPEATRACRIQSKAKADALEKLLGLRPAKRPAKASGMVKTGKPSAKPRRKR